MAKKQDAYYFDNFKACAELSAKSAAKMYEIMSSFDVARMAEYRREMHDLEHAADMKKHEISEVLVKAFITPIDREDIVQVSQNLDELSDYIEDVLIKMYCNHVTSIRPDALRLMELVVKCSDAVLDLINEFADFKRSKKLKETIININSLESEADLLFMKCMHTLHGEKDDLLEIIMWRDIYSCIERCSDAADHIADVVESVIMKNS